MNSVAQRGGAIHGGRWGEWGGRQIRSPMCARARARVCVFLQISKSKSMSLGKSGWCRLKVEVVCGTPPHTRTRAIISAKARRNKATHASIRYNSLKEEEKKERRKRNRMRFQTILWLNTERRRHAAGEGDRGLCVGGWGTMGVRGRRCSTLCHS